MISQSYFFVQENIPASRDVKNCKFTLDKPNSRQSLVKGEKLARYELGSVINNAFLTLYQYAPTATAARESPPLIPAHNQFRTSPPPLPRAPLKLTRHLPHFFRQASSPPLLTRDSPQSLHGPSTSSSNFLKTALLLASIASGVLLMGLSLVSVLRLIGYVLGRWADASRSPIPVNQVYKRWGWVGEAEKNVVQKGKMQRSGPEPVKGPLNLQEAPHSAKLIQIGHELDIYMSLRRGKKKKVMRLPPDREKLATDRLFEISTMWDDQEEDGSKVLADQVHRPDSKAEMLKKLRPSTKDRVGLLDWRRKSYSLEKEEQMRSVNLEELMREKRHIRTESGIFNMVSSNKVFVGHCKPLPSSRILGKAIKDSLLDGPQRRALTIPVISSKLLFRQLNVGTPSRNDSIGKKLQKLTERCKEKANLTDCLSHSIRHPAGLGLKRERRCLRRDEALGRK